MSNISNKYVILNLVALVMVLCLNFMAVSLPLNNKTTGALSDQYPNYFVPSGFTFAIWGVIYLLLISFVAYQIYQLYHKNETTLRIINRIGPLFLVNGLANASWIIAWHYEFVFASVCIMLIILSTLYVMYMQVVSFEQLNLWDSVFILIPISVYFGWISVATIANFTALLVSHGWNGGPISPQMWTSIMIGIATFLGIAMVFKKRDIFYSMVIVWALWGIFSKQSISTDPTASSVATAAQYGMTLLAIYIVLNTLGRKTYLNTSHK